MHLVYQGNLILGFQSHDNVDCGPVGCDVV